MNRILLLILCCLNAGALCAGNRFSLNGVWKFKPVEAVALSILPEIGESTVECDSLPVPGNWDIESRYANYVGAGCYSRTFRLPADWKKPRTVLRFEAVYERATVYLNGVLLGQHVGGYTPFEFDITGRVRDDNHLVVVVDNSYKRGAWWAWGGISRDVSLVNCGPTRILSQHITTKPDLKTGEVAVKVKYNIEQTGARQPLRLSYQIQNAKGKSIYKGVLDCPPGSSDTLVTDVAFTLPAGMVELWQLDRPVCYDFSTVLYGPDRKRADNRTDRIGVRRIEVDGTRLLLNGEAIRLNGLNRIHDHRAYGNTEPEELVKKDIRLIKSLGGNMARIMHAPLAPALLDYCDEIGFLLIPEIPVWGQSDPQAFPDNPRTKQWLREMISRDFNHPSIIGWSVGNELGDTLSETDRTRLVMTKAQYEYVKSMVKYVKEELDPNRLITYASFTAFRKYADSTNEPAALLDFICVNCYGTAQEQLRQVHSKWPDKPLFASEYGKGQLGLSPNAALPAAVIAMQDTLACKLPYVLGTALWSFNDYRSNYKGSTPSQNRGWGVVNEWRQPKQAFDQLQRLYAPVRDLQCSASSGQLQITITPRKQVDMPSYRLEGYSLQYSQYRMQGEPKAPRRIMLPVINPGDAPLEYKVGIGMMTVGVIVELVSPQGITVRKSRFDLRLPLAPVVEKIESGSDGFRIYLTPHQLSDSYTLRYLSGNDTVNLVGQTGYIEVKCENKPENVAITAVNTFGESEATIVPLPVDQRLLPPHLLHVEPLRNSMVVGYESLAEDSSYVISYRMKNKQGYTEIETSLRGSCKVDGIEPGLYEVRMKRKTPVGESDWGRTVQIEIH